MARRFSRSQRLAVEIVTEQQGEADHIQPFSKGGKTTVENCQLLPSETNKKKGVFVFTPRLWQKDFFEKWDKRANNTPFLLIAIPGGGKTMAALEVCRQWMKSGGDKRVIVVVPTVNLQEQWRDEAHKFGLAMQTKEFGTNFKHGFQGGVVTYHLVANQPLVFRKLCSVAPTMVIFDEVHHCGDEAHFGNGIKQAFELAKEKLLMSGTPWKTDGTPIPFVNYDSQGFAVGDHVYDLPSALSDEVVRYINFDHTKGSIINDCTGETEIVCQDISDSDAAQRLRKLLDPHGDYVGKQIAMAHEKLLEYRKEIKDAGAMAVCIDQFHAEKIAQRIKSITGCEPSVIVSDAAKENDTVKQFRKSKKEWLVSVRKVSEGTDIKRLQVLCYLTNTTSELFFRQIVGRVSRYRDIEDFEASVFLPADPRLIRCVRDIEFLQIQALKDSSEKESREPSESKEQELFDFASYSTRHEGTEVVFIGGQQVSIELAKKVEVLAEAVGIPLIKALKVIEFQKNHSSVSVESFLDESPKEDNMDEMRKKCNRAAFRLHKILGTESVKDIHKKFKPHKDMTETELQEKLNILVNEINKASNNG